MLDRRQLLIRAGTTALLASAPGLAIAKPLVIDPSPLLGTSEVMLSYVTRTRQSQTNIGHPNLLYPKSESDWGRGFLVEIWKVVDHSYVEVKSTADAEDHLFRMTRIQEPRLEGFHRFITMGNRIANVSRRGYGGWFFAEADTWKQFGFVKSEDRIGRWDIYILPRTHALFGRDDLGMTFFGTDDRLPFGGRVFGAYAGGQTDRVGVMFIKDNAIRLVLQPGDSADRYVSLMEPPAHIMVGNDPNWICT